MIITAVGPYSGQIIVCVNQTRMILQRRCLKHGMLLNKWGKYFSALLLPIQKLLELLNDSGIGKYIKPAAEGLESFRDGINGR